MVQTIEKVHFKITADQIVPPDLQFRLQHLGYQADINAYAIGDIGIILEDELPSVPRHEIHKAMGQYANRAPDTIRDYIYVSRRVSERMRSTFDMFGRHHHKAIADFSKGNEKLHEELCLKALELGDDYGGGIPSVSVLRGWLEQRDGAPPIWLKYFKSMRRTCERLQEGDAPQVVKTASKAFLIATAHVEPDPKPAHTVQQ